MHQIFEKFGKWIAHRVIFQIKKNSKMSFPFEVIPNFVFCVTTDLIAEVYLAVHTHINPTEVKFSTRL